MKQRPNPNTRPPRIPPPDWNTILDGRTWELTLGEDVGYTRSTLRTYAYTQARQRGGRATVVYHPHHPHLVYVTFVPDPNS